MTHIDKEYAERLLEEAREALKLARSIISRRSLDEFMADPEARYALRYTLILLVESLADLSVAILEADFGEAPASYREAFLSLSTRGITGYTLAESMARLASLRNLLVHRYWNIDDARLYRETGENLSLVERLVEELERYVEADKDP